MLQHNVGRSCKTHWAEAAASWAARVRCRRCPDSCDIMNNGRAL